jgi:hypothetical protein
VKPRAPEHADADARARAAFAEHRQRPIAGSSEARSGR